MHIKNEKIIKAREIFLAWFTISVIFGVFNLFFTTTCSTLGLGLYTRQCSSAIEQNEHLGWPIKYIPPATNESYKHIRNWGIVHFLVGKANYINFFMSTQLFAALIIAMIIFPFLFIYLLARFGPKKLLYKKLW